MNHPNLALMKQYGTAEVFQEKTAGVSPFASRVAAAVFTGHMISAGASAQDHQKMEAHQLNEQFRLMEQRQMEPAIQNLQHTRAPMFVQAGSDLPVGWDEGMVRLASIAHACGAWMAKAAAAMPAPMAPKPGPGLIGGAMTGLLGKNWKMKALGTGALLGGGYMALKGVNAGLGALGRPAPTATYGTGPQVPMGVNQYGYPQGGTPLMG